MTSYFDITNNLISSLNNIVLGRSDTVKLTISALIADGHVLLEDYPGSGKTTLAKTLGKLIAKDGDNHEILPFRRIQFTPDLLPGDVLGVSIFEPKSGTFRFMHGPVFAHVVLADEINRTGPKVQSAFLECMAEKQVTIDNNTYPLDELFFVLGTQNPLDIAGTYPLPIVQLDRFLMKVPMPYVDSKTENLILEQQHEISSRIESQKPVCTRSDIIGIRKIVQKVHIHPALRESIVGIVQATRNNPILQYGASTRSAIMLQAAVQAWSFIHGRDFSTADDLKAVLPYVLLHRLKFHSNAGEPRKLLKKISDPFIERLALLSF